MMIVAALVLIALPPAWYWGSPWWTLWRMREAARSGDVVRLASYVDFARLAAGARANRKSALSSLVRMVRSDSPERREFLANAKRSLVRDSGPGFADLQPWLSEVTDHAYVRHKGLSGFELRYRDASENDGPVLTFRREGLGWRLVGVRFG
jgi:hypothetical protein